MGLASPSGSCTGRAFPFVYDLDDPIFLPYRSPANGWSSLLKFHGEDPRGCSSWPTG